MVLKCRSCLIKVESQDSVNIFTTTKAGQLISDFLLSLAPIQILNNDGFPTNLCRSCEEKVNVLVDFRTLLMTSDAVLRKMKNTSVTNKDQTLIKDEILEDYLHTEEILEEKYHRNQSPDFCFDSPTWQENKQSKSENIEIVDSRVCCPSPITQQGLLQNLVCVKEELMNEDFLLEDTTTDQLEEGPSCSEQMEETASFSNDADELKIPPEDSEVTPVTALRLLPEKSRRVYKLVYKRFKRWFALKKIKNITENACLTYFSERAKHVKPPTLWSEYSMVKASLLIEEKIDLKPFFKLTKYLKRQSTGYHCQKPRVFNKDQIWKFVNEAPDDTYLMMKVVAIFGVAGACKNHELQKMSFNDVEDTGSMLVINIPTARINKSRSFVIDCETTITKKMVETYRKYVALRPQVVAHKRLFIQYRNGKCSVQPVGIHTFGKIPSEIAKYFGLFNPQEYTGRCFWKSSSTIVGEDRQLI